ncbi:hypothetical protein J6590_061263 [Homalodisca vitripennis]|nr:hypothetical protein J6590_061263 [Homalodisca vitripennis]
MYTNVNQQNSHKHHGHYGLAPKIREGNGLPLNLPSPDHRLPVPLFQMALRGADEITDIDILCDLRLYPRTCDFCSGLPVQ